LRAARPSKLVKALVLSLTALPAEQLLGMKMWTSFGSLTYTLSDTLGISQELKEKVQHEVLKDLCISGRV
jgi:hypothetical protein